MDDGKREVAVSTLLLTPSSRDMGSSFTCRVSNPAAPAGKQTTVTLNVQCEWQKDQLVQLPREWVWQRRWPAFRHVETVFAEQSLDREENSCAPRLWKGEIIAF